MTFTGSSNGQAPIQRIVIVGGGTAGWMTAAALGFVFRGSPMRIDLVESEAIGTVGVGEATIPEILKFNAMLGIDEADFMRATGATFKLGIEFAGWGSEEERYFHPFGVYGTDMEGIGFHHFWAKSVLSGAHASPIASGDIADYCLAWQAARQGKFAHPSGPPESPLSGIRYAYHFDATRYAAFLRRFAEAHKVTRHEGRVVDVMQDDISGIGSVTLEDGRNLVGDLFVDCTGFYGLLIEKTLGSGYEDWSHWLPCDSAIAVPSDRAGAAMRPYTRATAREAGWQWNIPLQHRTGNGYVYSSHFTDDEAARGVLMGNLDGKPLAEPRHLRFTTGKRREIWKANCVAVGLASGFLEPLESTSIHLIQSAITKLLNLFPASRDDAATRAIFNRLMDQEFRTIRDFLILHYSATSRSGTAFWDYVRTMEVPDFLADKIALFRHSARIMREENEIFTEPSWLAVLVGQGILPQGYHPVADALSDDENAGRLRAIADTIERAAGSLPRHEDLIARYCASS